MHGTRGICGHEFHHELLSAADVRASVGGAFVRHGREHVGVPLLRQAEVDKTGAGNFNGGKPGAFKLQICNKRLSNFPRGHVKGSGRSHGVVCGEVAVGGVLGYLHHAAELSLRQLSRRGGPGAGRFQKCVYAVLCRLYKVHIVFLSCSRTFIRNLLRPNTAWSISTT